jgi:hypothetical protein
VEIKEYSVADKRMLIIDAEVARKIDENRGDMSNTEFINFLIESRLNEKKEDDARNYVPREEYDSFVQGMKELLRNFMEFFISYEVELGEKPDNEVFKQLNQKLKTMSNPSEHENKCSLASLVLTP